MAVSAVLRLAQCPEPHQSEPWYPPPYTGGTPAPLSKSPKAIAFRYKNKGYNFSGGNELNSVAWNASNASGSTWSVGLKIPNELGLYDMSGNVWEWVSDFNSFPYNVNGYDKTIKYRIFKGFSYREQIGSTYLGGMGGVDYKPESRPVKFFYIGPSASNGQTATTDSVTATIYGEIPNAKTDRIGFRYARNASVAMVTTLAGSGFLDQQMVLDLPRVLWLLRE